MKHSREKEGKAAGWSKGWLLYAPMALVGLALLSLSGAPGLERSGTVQADAGDCEGDEFIGSVNGSQNSITFDAGEGNIVTGVCIKSADHSGELGNGPFSFSDEPCYMVSGVGGQTVTVARVEPDSPECQALSHIDVRVEEEVTQVNTPTSVPPTNTPTTVPPTSVPPTSTPTGEATEAPETPTTTPEATATPTEEATEEAEIPPTSTPQTIVIIPQATATEEAVVSGAPPQAPIDVEEEEAVESAASVSEVAGVTALPATGSGPVDSNPARSAFFWTGIVLLSASAGLALTSWRMRRS
jgi:hypothetical protein